MLRVHRGCGRSRAAHPARAADCAAGRTTVAQADVFTHSGDVIAASAIYEQGAKILGSCREAELAAGDEALWLTDSETESYALRSAALLLYQGSVRFRIDTLADLGRCLP